MSANGRSFPIYFVWSFVSLRPRAVYTLSTSHCSMSQYLWCPVAVALIGLSDAFLSFWHFPAYSHVNFVMTATVSIITARTMTESILCDAFQVSKYDADDMVLIHWTIMCLYTKSMWISSRIEMCCKIPQKETTRNIYADKINWDSFVISPIVCLMLCSLFIINTVYWRVLSLEIHCIHPCTHKTRVSIGFFQEQLLDS